jgi:hypothetical protein
MTVRKQFAEDGGELDACMDQLVEVLVQLLAEPNVPGVPIASTDLHSENTRAIHVSEDEQIK